MRRTSIRVTDEIAAKVAFVAHCADRAEADDALVTRAKVDLADAVIAAVNRPTRAQATRLRQIPLEPVGVVEVTLQRKRRA